MAIEIEMLREVSLFESLDEEELRTLAPLLDRRSFSTGETLFTRGEVGDCLYVVRQGRVQIYVESTEGQKIVLAENGPGDMFGEIALFDGGPRTASAVAVEDAETFVCDRQDLLALVTKRPHAALDLLGVMGKRLRATNELLRTHVTRNLNVEEEERLTFGQRVADRVAVFGGSWTFILAFFGMMAAWMALNFYLAGRAIDPFPFILLNLGLSALAGLQAPVIMMSQNRQGTKDRLKADLDYEVNLKAELEIAHLHQKTDRIHEAMLERFARLEKAIAR